MKKTFFIFISIALISNLAKAQTTEFDALNLAQTEIRGTARYMGMAGAFGALGADPSALKINPAGLAVYRSSELSLSYSVLNQDARARFYGIETTDNLQKFGYNNFSYVWSMDTRNTKGLLYSNWSFSHSRTKNFNRHAKVKGIGLGTSILDKVAALTNDVRCSKNDLMGADSDFNAYNNPSFLSIMAYKADLLNYFPNEPEEKRWEANLAKGALTDFDYTLTESGYISESTLNWGGNINNILYVGAGVNFSNIKYTRHEFFRESSNYNLENNLSTYGYGINFNLGLIYRPVEPLRLGISYTSPTRYGLTDETYNVYLNKVSAPSQYYDYSLRTPGRLNTSIAYVFGKRIILSSDLTYVPMSQLSFGRQNNFSYDLENNKMNKFNAEITIKTGFEVRFTDNLYARAGFAHTGFSKASKTAMELNPIKAPHPNTIRTDLGSLVRKSNRYYTAGIGYRGNFWSLDFACVKRNFEENYTPYDSLDDQGNRPSGTLKTNSLDFIGTLAFRF